MIFTREDGLSFELNNKNFTAKVINSPKLILALLNAIEISQQSNFQIIQKFVQLTNVHFIIHHFKEFQFQDMLPPSASMPSFYATISKKFYFLMIQNFILLIKKFLLVLQLNLFQFHRVLKNSKKDGVVVLLNLLI